MDPELIASFTAVTEASEEKARQYLEVSDGDLPQAIQLFYESGGVDMAPPEPTTQSTATQSHGGASNNPIHIDSDNDLDEATRIQAGGHDEGLGGSGVPQHLMNSTVEDDEAMAKRLQEELYAGGDSGGTFAEDTVRAPMARTTETLVGPDADGPEMAMDMRAAVAEQMMARQRRQANRPGIFNQQPTAGVWDSSEAGASSRRRDLALATGGASEAGPKSNRLAELFRPPFDIMSRLPWDEARDQGKEQQKWLLINVQNPSIFDCQILNRDIWRSPDVKETIKEHFIFMQFSKDDPDGDQYMQYYFQARESDDAYPHIAIVDPRTGEQVKVWSGPPVPKPLDFVAQLYEFLDRYSLNAHSKNPVAVRKAEQKPALDLGKLSEEEMLELAMQNSLANHSGPRDADPDELTRNGTGDLQTTHASTSNTTAEPPPEEAPTSAFDGISSTNPHTEPAADPATTTRIQFRHPGGRQIHRFLLTDTVRRIYEWLKAAPLDGKEGKGFELVFMGKNLIDLLDSTVEDAGLKNGTCMVEFTEE